MVGTFRREGEDFKIKGKGTLLTTLFFSLLIGQKQWREKKEERGQQYHVSMREKIVQKLSKSDCQNIIYLSLIIRGLAPYHSSEKE
jgi:hypothetical protein